MNPLLAGAALGLGKSLLVDMPQAERQRQLAATTASLSPWTGLQPTMPQEASPFGSAVEGATAGYLMGQSQEKFDLDKQKHALEMQSKGYMFDDSGKLVRDPKSPVWSQVK